MPLPAAATTSHALTLALLALGAAGVAAAPAREVLVVNRGVGGHSTRDGLARFERDVLEARPDHLILYFGINDAGNSRKLVPLDEFRANLQSMIDRARAGGTQSIVLVTPNPIIAEHWALRHPTHPRKHDIAAHLAEYDAAVRDLAATNKLPVADLRQLVEQRGGAVERRHSLVRNLANSKTRDGVHLTETGYQLLAGLFEPILKGKVKPGQLVVCMGDSITYGAHVDGAGTSCGRTYPAWLWLLLNRMAGATERDTPRDPVRRDPSVLLANGSFEQSADRVHPDDWRLWNVPGRQEGALTLLRDPAAAHDGERFLRVTAENPDAPACLNSAVRAEVTPGSACRLSWWARGRGSVRAQALLYDKREFRGTLPAGETSVAPVAEDWQEQALEFDVPEDAGQVLVRFGLTGVVDLDAVSLNLTRGPAVKAPLAPQGPGPELANSRLSLAFYPAKQGGGLRSIRNAAGQEFLNGACDGTLWRLELRRIPDPGAKRPQTKPLSLDPEQDDGALRKDDPGEALVLSSNAFAGSVAETPGGLVLSWQGVDVGDEGGALDVTVSATLAEGDRFARFRTSITCRSRRYTVFYVTSPLVSGLYPPDGRTELDRLASPVFNGRLISDPIRNGILGKPYRFQANRSGHSMQFDAYYHEGRGLYLGCFDGRQNAKRYFISADPRAGLAWGVAHVPNNMKAVPQQWSTPYDTVIGCFEGDWYDACRIYREWALQQSWTREGPLHLRTSTPKWFKEMDDWLSWAVTQRPLHLVYDPTILESLKGLNLGVIVHHWGKGAYGCDKTPDRFPLEPGDLDYLAEAKKHGFPVLAYIQGLCWDTDTESFRERDGFEHTVRNFHDQRVVWNLGRGKKRLVAAIAYPGQVWTEVLGDTIEKMAAAGYAVAYLDSFNHAGTYLNFNPLYSQGECGGGNRYIKDNQRLLEAVRARARSINPEFCFTSESFWEGNLAHIDGYLVCNTTNQPLERGVIMAVPMIHAVYHDYTVCYSNWHSKWDLEQENARGYLAKYAQTFVWGVKSAWTQPRHLLTERNHEIALDAAVKRGRAYAAARKFLIYGEMLRPPAMLAPAKSVDLRWYRGWSTSYYDISAPAVLHSFWRAPSGELGLVLYNIDDASHGTTVRLRDPAYGLKQDEPCTIRYVHPAAGAPVSMQWRGPHEVELSLPVPARSPVVLEIVR